MKVIFNKKYLDYSFGENHPFWPERATIFLEYSKRKKFLFELIEAERAADNDILLVHTRAYLEKVKKLARNGGFLSIDTPVDERNLEAAYYYVGGTIIASQLALKGELAINLLGGLHHAESNNSSGFCIFNDHAVAIRKLQNERKIKNAAILDLDVHAGNGTQEIFYRDPSVFTISIHQDPSNFYPGTGFSWQKGEGKGFGFNLNIPLSTGSGEKEYLRVLDETIPKIRDYNPDILVVVLGVDTYKNDPIANLALEKETYGKIAERLAIFPKKCILFAGGYSKETPELWYIFLKNLI